MCGLNTAQPMTCGFPLVMTLYCQGFALGITKLVGCFSLDKSRLLLQFYHFLLLSISSFK